MTQSFGHCASSPSKSSTPSPRGVRKDLNSSLATFPTGATIERSRSCHSPVKASVIIPRRTRSQDSGKTRGDRDAGAGRTWTLELHELDSGMTLGTLVDWISSGVLTSQPQPDDALAHQLLANRGLHLYPGSAAGPCPPSRNSIGYVSADP